MSKKQIAGSTLCSYSLNTSPQPLQVSPEKGNIIYGAITFVLSHDSDDPVTIAELQFVLPKKGTGPGALTNDPDAILHSSSPGDQWNIRMTKDGVFTAIPALGIPVVVRREGIVFQFYNIPMNQQVGTVYLTVIEKAYSAIHLLEERKADFTIAKFPSGFFFNNLTAQVPMVEDGHNVVLTWDGSDKATYHMFFDLKPEGVDVSDTRAWSSPALHSDTNFLLRATVKSEFDGTSVTTDRTATVMVANPELNVTSLSVRQIASLAGDVTVGSVLTAQKDLVVSGSSKLNQITADGDLIVNGNTILNKPLTASAGIATEKLSASAQTTLADTLIKGTLGATSAVGTLGKAERIYPGTYLAYTDGFVFGKVNTIPDPKATSVTYISIMTDGINTYATGGNFAAIYHTTGDSYNYVAANMPDSCSIAVRKGNEFSLGVQQYVSNQQNPEPEFYWVPNGSISPGFKKINEEQIPVELMPKIITEQLELASLDPTIRHLIEAFEEVFGKSLSTTQKEKLHLAVKALMCREGIRVR